MRLATFIVTVTFSYKKLRKTFLKNIKEIFKKFKHTRRSDVLGRHYYVKKIQYECPIRKVYNFTCSPLRISLLFKLRPDFVIWKMVGK